MPISDPDSSHRTDTSLHGCADPSGKFIFQVSPTGISRPEFLILDFSTVMEFDLGSHLSNYTIFTKILTPEFI